MNVPNHEKKSFAALLPDERNAIIDGILSGSVELYWSAADKWEKKVGSMIDVNSIYRTRQRKLVIPWEHVHPDMRNAVLTEGGIVLLSAKPFTFVEGRWLHNDAVYNYFPSVVNTEGVYWKDSQVERPK